jgi:hypothetical protein
VSAVLRPVGPHEARVYWIRRAVVVAVIVVIVIAVIELLPGGGSAKPAGTHHTPPPKTTTSSSPPTTTTVAACDPTVIKLVLSTDSDTYTAGQSPKLVGTFRNPSSTPCTLASAAANENWRITSGNDKIWSTKGCSTSTASAQLKIKAGGSKTVSITWDGHRLETGCTEGSAALPGEYVLRGKLDGVTGQPAVFHIT